MKRHIVQPSYVPIRVRQRGPFRRLQLAVIKFGLRHAERKLAKLQKEHEEALKMRNLCREALLREGLDKWN